MLAESLSISDVKVFTPKRFADERGHFAETYNRRVFGAFGVSNDFVQDNQSRSAKAGTVRGLHYQKPPFAQAKLVRILKGAVLDVVVDARKSSPTFGKWASVVLSEANGKMIFVPAGFLHGFATREPDTVVAYKVDAYYDKASDGSVLWNDPDLGIDWELAPSAAVLSEKDAAAQRWADFRSPF
jgi:dTDP-4-dehydrorhamnose 3,5-epimerase